MRGSVLAGVLVAGTAQYRAGLGSTPPPLWRAGGKGSDDPVAALPAVTTPLLLLAAACTLRHIQTVQCTPAQLTLTVFQLFGSDDNVLLLQAVRDVRL